MTKIIAFVSDASAATSIEYAMIAAGIAVVLVGAVSSLGWVVKSNYTSVGAALK